MKARTIAGRIAAGVLSMSLLMSSTSVAASQADETNAAPETAVNASNPPQTEVSGDSDMGTESKPDGEPDQSRDGEEPETDAGDGGGTDAGAADSGTSGTEFGDGTEDASDDSGIEPDGGTEDEPETDSEEQETDSGESDTETEAEDDGEADEQQSFSLERLQSVDGDIQMDGDLSDWAMVTPRSSADGRVDEWKVALSPDGTLLYFAYTGTARTEWDYEFSGASRPFVFQFADGSTGRDSQVSVVADRAGVSVKDSYYEDIPGASGAVVNQAHGNNAGPYGIEFAVPVSFFHSSDFVILFAGETVAADDIEQVNGNALAPEEPPVYTGISIDGSYADWAAVEKTSVVCSNENHRDCISETAVVYDGDWFYIYIKDGAGGNASNAGTHSNGKFAIYSDLGYESDIQLSTAPSVSGVDGAEVAYVGREWEIAIPKDQLPKYKESLSFGFYLGDVLIENIVNLQEDSDNNLDNLFNGVICDGQYEDWEGYGHTTIEYDTPGSQEQHIDAKGALYSTGETLFGHVITDAPDHLAEAGGEFLKGVTVAFNQKLADLQSGNVNRELTFNCLFVTVDADGNINWSPQREGYAEGTYKFVIASIDAWQVSSNVSDLHESDLLYGDLYMTIGKNGVDEMEFCLDLPMIAKKFGVDKTDLKQIAAQFVRIGHQWIYTAGTSTGPFSVVLPAAVAGLVIWRRRRKYQTTEWAPAGA